jgi:hypothetical protein
MSAPSRKSFALRLDPALHAVIERLASQELRSVNAQIEFLLREALSRRGANPSFGFEADQSTTEALEDR